MCDLSGRKIDRSLDPSDRGEFPSLPGRNDRNSRRIIDKRVSIIGRPRARIGTMIETATEPFVELTIESTASEKPINRLPQSPRNIRAGLKLYRRNPIRAPRSEENTSELQSRG